MSDFYSAALPQPTCKDIVHVGSIPKVEMMPTVTFCVYHIPTF